MAQQSLELLISDNAEKAAQHVARLASELDRLQSAIRPGSIGALANRLKQISGETSAGAMGKVAESISAATTQMERFATSIENAVTTLSGLKGGTGNNALRDVADDARMASSALAGIGQGSLGETVNLGSAVESAQEFTGAIQDANSQMVTLASETQSVGDAAGAAAGGQDEFAGAATGAAGAADEENVALKSLKDALEGVKKNVGGLFSSFARIARFRLFRTIIRAITTAFKEGLENVRAYSKAINGLYSKDMDKFDNAVLKMKNSLGASLAVALQALLPIIHQFINGIIQAANVFNQFMALLNGHTSWTKAVDVVASDFEKAEKSGTGAAKAAKNLLAAWDELNIIQSQTGGGGGGSNNLTSDDYKKMFEESFEFEGWIKDTIEFMESHLPIVHGLLAGIAGYLLGIKNIGVIMLAIGLVTTIDNATGIAKNGFTKENLMTAATGALQTGLGLGLLFSTKGAAGMILGTIAGILVSTTISLVADFQFRYSMKDIGDAIAAGFGAVLTGSGAGLLIGGMLGHPLAGLAIGAAATIGMLLYAKFTVDEEAKKKGISVTEAELRKYVSENAFTASADATITLLNTTVEKTESARQAVITSLSSMTIPLEQLKFGINKADAYDSLMNQIFGSADGQGHRSGGIIDLVKEYARTSTIELQTMFSLTSAAGIDTVAGSAETLLFGQETWNMITGDIEDAGGKLAELLEKGFTDGVANFDEEAATALIEEIMEMTRIVTRAQIAGQAYSNFMVNMYSGEMTAEEAYKQYEKELSDAFLASEFGLATQATMWRDAWMLKASKELDPEKRAVYEGKASRAGDIARDITDNAYADAQKWVHEMSRPGAELIAKGAKEEAVNSSEYARYADSTAKLVDDFELLANSREFADGIELLTAFVDQVFGKGMFQKMYDAEMNPLSLFSEDELAALKATATWQQHFGAGEATGGAINLADNGTISINGQNVVIQTDPTYGAVKWSEYTNNGDSEGDRQAAEQSGLMRQMLTQLQQLNGKDFSVTISPSASFGRLTEMSRQLWNRTTGTQTTGP